jgi:hypothetical protein
MIYTCYDMIRDCRANLPAGWEYFVRGYVPVIRKVLAHYQAEAPDGGIVERVVIAARNPGSSLFQSLDPSPERWFAAELRQRVVAEIANPVAEIEVSLEQVAAALGPLTLLEKQATWFETMRYDAAHTGALLRMSGGTVQKIRDRASELLRSQVESWRRTVLTENGGALGRAAGAEPTAECLPPKPFLDILDGRTTWSGREELERHVTGCWHCVDHFCRLVEVIDLLRGVEPLSDAEAEPFRKLLGLPQEKTGFFKRWTSRTAS